MPSADPVLTFRLPASWLRRSRWTLEAHAGRRVKAARGSSARVVPAERIPSGPTVSAAGCQPPRPKGSKHQGYALRMQRSEVTGDSGGLGSIQLSYGQGCADPKLSSARLRPTSVPRRHRSRPPRAHTAPRAEQDMDMPESYGRPGRLKDAGRAFREAIELARRNRFYSVASSRRGPTRRASKTEVIPSCTADARCADRLPLRAASRPGARRAARWRVRLPPRRPDEQSCRGATARLPGPRVDSCQSLRARRGDRYRGGRRSAWHGTGRA